MRWEDFTQQSEAKPDQKTFQRQSFCYSLPNFLVLKGNPGRNLHMKCPLKTLELLQACLGSGWVQKSYLLMIIIYVPKFVHLISEVVFGYSKRKELLLFRNGLCELAFLSYFASFSSLHKARLSFPYFN